MRTEQGEASITWSDTELYREVNTEIVSQVFEATRLKRNLLGCESLETAEVSLSEDDKVDLLWMCEQT